MKSISSWLSLFASSGTLFCCALPSLLVALGMGAAMAGLVTTVPQIIWLSEYKAWVFTFSAIMLVLAGFLQYRARFEPCPIDEAQARACMRSRKISFVIYTISLILWLIGAFFAFLAPFFFN